MAKMVNNVLTINETGSEADAVVKVFEIMKYLIANVEQTNMKQYYNWDTFDLTTRMIYDKTDFILGKNGMQFFTRVSDNQWTLVELFVRQYLSNGSDGFLMVNVEESFDYIMDNIDFIIEQDMISERGFNKSGNELWTDYRPISPKRR